jgi:hypothetical protein
MKLMVLPSVLAILIGFSFGAGAQPATPAQSSAPEASATAPATPAVATAPVTPAAPKVGKPFFIEFRARNALSYGHTFAVIGRSGQKLTKANVVGLHPASESSIPWMVGHFILVPSETGWSDGDIEDQYILAKYRIPLGEAEYKRLMTYVTALKAKSPVWHAVLYNCNAFVGDIATHLGLKIPSSSMLMPKEYISELRSLNTVKRTAAPASTARVN